MGGVDMRGLDMIGRRKFLGRSVAGAAAWAFAPAARALGSSAAGASGSPGGRGPFPPAPSPPASRAVGATDRIRRGMSGRGSRGQELLRQLLKLVDEDGYNAQRVAVADVYPRRHDEVRKTFPEVKAFTDHPQ